MTSVVSFPKLGTADIAAGLRNLADEIDDGIGSPFAADGLTDVETVVWVARSALGTTAIGALGRCSGGLDEAAGLMLRAIIRGTPSV